MTAPPLVAHRDALADVVESESALHAWEPFECVCSCGVVPPVVDKRHQVDRHQAEAIADALLASGAVQTPAGYVAGLTEADDKVCDAIAALANGGRYDGLTVGWHLERALERLRALSAALGPEKVES